MTLNRQLTFSDHVRTIIGTVSLKINTLAYVRKYVGPHTALTIYRSTILPVMEYANLIQLLYSNICI